MPERGLRLLDKPLATDRYTVDLDPSHFAMAPLALEALEPGRPTPADLYLAQFNARSNQVEMNLVCPKGEEFKSHWRDHLLESAQRMVFVPMDQVPRVGSYFRECAGDLLASPEVAPRRKRLMLQEMASLNLRELFAGDLSPKAITQAVGQAEDVLRRLLSDCDLLCNLSQILHSDYNVFTHSVNVSLLAMALGRHLKLGQAKVEALGMAGMLHDLGRARLPRELLGKTGHLSPQEWRMMRGHCQLGYQMLGKVPKVSLEVLKMVLHHHENADGSGYPHGLKAQDTPLGARLLRIVDAYDAMTSQRSYRPAKQAFEAASEIIEHSSDVFGEDIVPHFVRFLASPLMGCR